MKLIDKDKVVQEIERRIQVSQDYTKCNLTENTRIGNQAQQLELNDILSFLYTLETKEVDLAKDIKDYIYEIPHAKTGIPGGWKYSWDEEKVIEIAKHFYELGLQKGE